MASHPITEDPAFLASQTEAFAHANIESSALFGDLLDEVHFVRMLRLERKKCERSGESFMLMLVDLANLSGRNAARNAVRDISMAIAASTRETDVFGWYEQGQVLGLLISQIGKGSSPSSATLVASRVRNAMQTRLTGETFDALDLRVRIFPDESHDERGNGTGFTFYRDLSAVHDVRRSARTAKRLIDIVISALGLIALLPVMLAIALLVKFSSKGPVLFRQRRIGQFGVPFTFLKFRSMYPDNDPRIHQEFVARLIAGNAQSQNGNDSGKATYKIVNDPRITPIGRFLRKSSLDELPQLINVLKGEMSLVGPRPPVPYEFERYQLWHKRRVVEVKPGITGLWQVHGRSKTSFDEMVRLDLRYVRAWSLWLDLKILTQTPKAVLSGDGAY